MAHSHPHSEMSGRKLFWTIIFNSVITLAEFLAGLFSGYLALLADAVHNLSDVAALVLAWIGVKGSQLPPTKKSTYGFKRIEVMTAFISAASLVVIAVYIIWEAYRRFVDPQPITRPWLFLTVAVIGLVGNLLSVWLLHTEKGKSLNFKTAFLHMAFDALSSVAVIAGGIVILLTGWVVIDVILSVAIALMIFWSSYLVIKETVLIFLEAVPPGIEFDKVHAAIEGIPDVCHVHDLHIWSLSSHETALSCHVCLDRDDLSAGPSVINRINSMIREKFGIGHGTVQLEVGECNRSDILCNHDSDRRS